MNFEVLNIIFYYGAIGAASLAGFAAFYAFIAVIVAARFAVRVPKPVEPECYQNCCFNNYRDRCEPCRTLKYDRRDWLADRNRYSHFWLYYVIKQPFKYSALGIEFLYQTVRVGIVAAYGKLYQSLAPKEGPNVPSARAIKKNE